MTNKQRKIKNGFKLADCISSMDVMKKDEQSVLLFLWFFDKVMEAREKDA